MNYPYVVGFRIDTSSVENHVLSIGGASDFPRGRAGVPSVMATYQVTFERRENGTHMASRVEALDVESAVSLARTRSGLAPKEWAVVSCVDIDQEAPCNEPYLGKSPASQQWHNSFWRASFVAIPIVGVVVFFWLYDFDIAASGVIIGGLVSPEYFVPAIIAMVRVRTLKQVTIYTLVCTLVTIPVFLLIQLADPPELRHYGFLLPMTLGRLIAFYFPIAGTFLIRNRRQSSR